MGAPEMYSDAYRDHLTGDPAYDKAFAALADCPSFAQVERALRTYAHELAEKIREDVTAHGNWVCCEEACKSSADLIDSEVSG